MPVYDFRCGHCGHETTIVCKIDERDFVYKCDRCGHEVTRVQVYRVAVVGDYAPYVSPATGKMVEGKRAHLDDLKRSGCRVREAGETQDFMAGRERRREESLDRAVDVAIRAAATEIGGI